MRFKERSRIALLAVGAVVACSDGPLTPDPGPATSSVSDADLEVAIDVDLAETAVSDAEISLFVRDAAEVPAEAQELIQQARETFRAAREAFTAGDEEEARRLATEARRLIAEAIILVHGEEAIARMKEQLATIIDRLAEPAEQYDRPAELKALLETILAEAEAACDAGDAVTAGERLLYAFQILDRARLRHRDMIRDRITYTRLAVARGHEAVQLATRLIGDGGTPTQLDLLQAAAALQRTAAAALGQGSFRRAAALAHRAEWTSLMAYVDIDGVSAEEAEMVESVAAELIEAAAAAIGDEPTAVQQKLLNIAKRLFHAGEQRRTSTDRYGVGLFWHSAVTAALLVSGEVDSVVDREGSAGSS